MTKKALPTNTLDQILAIQILIAWAGEGGDEPRLDWWKSEVLSEFGGFSTLQELMPNTALWLACKAAREIAKREDEKRRKTSSDSDQIYTIYRLGFEIDEQLEHQLSDLIHAKSSLSILFKDIPWVEDLTEQEWEQDGFDKWLRSLGERGTHKDEPTGRRIVGSAPEDILTRVQKLANHLSPLSKNYPMSYYKGIA